MTQDAAGMRQIRTGAMLTARLSRSAGRDGRYASCDEAAVVVAAGRWAAAESHAAAGKLLALAELIRRNPGTARMAGSGEMPAVWELGTGEQAALELGVSAGSAEGLLGLAHTLVTRLPLTLAALGSGILDLTKARMIAAETEILSDADAAEAERQLSGSWARRTWAQLHARLTRIVINLDPEAVAKRREAAQKHDARVRVWREVSGTCGLGGFGLPPDEALQANARIQARALAYRKAGIEGTLDLLRVRAYLDILTGNDARNGLPAPAPATDSPQSDSDDGPESGSHYNPESDSDGGLESGSDGGQNSGTDDDGEDDNGGAAGDSDGGPDNGGPGRDSAPGSDGPGRGIAAHVELTLPLATLLGLAERAGEAAWLGAIDPALVRQFGIAAARDHTSTFRLVITGSDGRAVAFGTARERTSRRTRRGNPPPPAPARPGRQAGSAGQAATPASRPGRSQTGMTSTGQAGWGQPGAGFEFGPTAGQGTLPLGGLPAASRTWGIWQLTAAGRAWDITIIPIPAPGPCDHRFRTASYQPGDTLRHLVQVRDGDCAMPTCARPARACEWEHAIPWPAGDTCAHNGGMHCKHDHRIKEAKGWAVRQLPDGRRQWTTPAGLTYLSEHYQYPD